MCDSATLEPVALGVQTAGAFVSAGAAASKSIADKAAYSTQARATSANAEVERLAAADALRRGQVTQANAAVRTNQLKGQQIAELAAHGVEIGEGSPLEILTGTDLMGVNDANVIAANAAKEAWGYDVRAKNDDINATLLRARADMESPGRAAAGSLLTSAGTVASRWYSTRHTSLAD